MDDLPIIDLAQLDRQTLSDSALRDEVLHMFVRQIADAERMLEGEGDEDVQLFELAHQIVGTARALGAFRLAEHASAVERDASAVESVSFKQSLRETREAIVVLLESGELA